MRPEMTIFVIPLYSNPYRLYSNPYQQQLYSHMKRNNPNQIETVNWFRIPWLGIPAFFIIAVWAAMRGARLAHIHWLAWDIRVTLPGRRRINALTTKLAVKWLKVLGFKIVWTVHNLVPHEPQTNDDAELSRFVARASDALIVHSSQTIKELSDLDIRTDHAVVIPQGNYIDSYEKPPTSIEARTALKLPVDGRTLLFFGMIRTYKGIPELLAAWDRLQPCGTLVIAGSCTDEEIKNQIDEVVASTPSVVAEIRFIPDSEVPSYFAACDCVCMPFRTLTTSASVLLAMSFGRPVIAPRIGSLQELPESTGIYYDSSPDPILSLTQSIREFFAMSGEDLEHMSHAAMEYAQQLSWSNIAERTHRLFCSVLNEAQ